MESVIFSVGVLLVGAVTAAEGLHDYVHDRISNRKSRRDGEQPREESSTVNSDRNRRRRNRRRNSSPDDFSEDAPRRSINANRPSVLLGRGFDHRPLPVKPDVTVDVYRPRYNGAIGPQDYVDSRSRDARPKGRHQQRRSLYEFDYPEQPELNRGTRAYPPSSLENRTTNLGRSSSVSSTRNQDPTRRSIDPPSRYRPPSSALRRMSYQGTASAPTSEYSSASRHSHHHHHNQQPSLPSNHITQWVSQVSQYQHPSQDPPDFAQPSSSRRQSTSYTSTAPRNSYAPPPLSRSSSPPPPAYSPPSSSASFSRPQDYRPGPGTRPGLAAYRGDGKLGYRDEFGDVGYRRWERGDVGDEGGEGEGEEVVGERRRMREGGSRRMSRSRWEDGEGRR